MFYLIYIASIISSLICYVHFTRKKTDIDCGTFLSMAVISMVPFLNVLIMIAFFVGTLKNPVFKKYG